MAAQISEHGGLAQRYAAALLELAEEKRGLDAVSADLVALSHMIAESSDLQKLITSPLMDRADQSRAIAAVAKAADFDDLTQRFVGLIAAKRRLFALPAIIKSFQKMLADKRGEVAAEVTAAHALTDTQKSAVVEAIKRVVGGKVSIDMKVDPSLLGGLIVRVGSRMIDGSVKTKLQKLQLAMKGVG
ncbi:F0F1 ATP synthase subunit delta [Dongia deserti]|uniref:F0F1 ATP synthase subunit delta n=1 Tax=Dongia deserti TaxID=2268030 RepID=UPI000E65CF6A|nr:F0F1 ATP synthase subunit delta [Dongia deserti]